VLANDGPRGGFPIAALMFRTGCSYRQKLEQLLVQLGKPAFKRLEFGSLDGILGCVAADVGITLLPQHVVDRSLSAADLFVHQVDVNIARAPTVFIQRREACETSAMKTFGKCFASVSFRRIALSGGRAEPCRAPSVGCARGAVKVPAPAHLWPRHVVVRRAGRAWRHVPPQGALRRRNTCVARSPATCRSQR
jgi:hypothetical protein